MKPPFSHEDLAFLMPRLERMARDLAFVPGSADDLLQDAWVEALQAKPETLRFPLRWMQVIMRRRSTKLRLAARLRKECEQLAAQFEAQTDQEAELASTTALVVSELEQLDSPYREVLRMRFLEERPVREIAERSGSSAETVRSQIHRGLARLRERLDRRAGSRELWAGMLLSATRSDAGPVPAGQPEPSGGDALRPQAPPEARAWLGSSTVGVGLASAALVVSGAAYWLWPSTPSTAAVAPTAASFVADPGSVVAAAPTSTDRVAAAAAATPEPRVAEPPPPPPAPTPGLPEDMTRLVLVVVDPDGRPVTDAQAEVYGRGIRNLHDGPVGPEGRLVLDIGVEELFDVFPLVGSVTLAATSDELTRSEMLAVELEPGRERTLTVRLDQPNLTLHGQVTDTEGEPIPGATVETRRIAVEQREPEPGVTCESLLLFTETDENGYYRLDGTVAERTQVTVSKPGFALLGTTVNPEAKETRADFTLRRGGIVAGFVSHANGLPASGARVWVGTPSARQRILPEAQADEDGFFLMSGLGDGEWEVFACDPQEPHLFAWTRVEARDGEESPFEAVLQPTTGVRVQVLDRDGAPFAHAGVIVTPTEPRSTWSAMASTDASGRAQILHVPDVPLDVRVYPNDLRGNGDPSAFRGGVRAGGPELTVQLGPSVGQAAAGDGEVRGILLQSTGEPFTRTVVYAVPTETASDPLLSPAGEMLLDDAGVGRAEVRADGSFVVDKLSPGEHRLYALSRLPHCAGILELGACTILPGEALELGTRSAPPGHPVRLEVQTSQEILLAARLGPFWQKCIRTVVDGSLELHVLAGSYWVGTREEGIDFDVPGDAVIVVPE